MAEAATLDTQPALTPMTMRDRYVGLMQSYAALRGKPTPELLLRIADFQHQVAGLGTRLAGSDARFEAQATINYWQTVRINAGERPDTILLADFDQEAARREAAGKPPYKGLAPYQRADSSFFVSRFKLVNDLTDMVKSKRLLALVGFSGSGKSSVVRAGLIPNLEGRAYDGIDDNGLTDSSTWAYPPPILPGADPVAALNARFKCTITAPADLVAALDAMNAAVLLTIDQFEEVFTLSDPGPRRTLFLDALVAAATTGAHRHIVVITMRKEYEGRITAHEAFNKLFTDDACREVKPMQPSELRKVIEEPAQRLGVGFEPKLVDELLAQVQGEPAGLPLLSFTLLKLWDKRGGTGDMKWADYKTLGGTPRDILAKSADDVYLGFNAQQDRDLVQGIFTLLAKIGDGFEATSNRVKRAELGILVNQDSEGGAIDAVLDRLATAGLIRMAPVGPIKPTTDIEVAHEALIRNWGRLTGWVKERFAQQTTRKAFTLRAEKWKERGRRNVDMLSGVSLDEAREFPDQSKVEEAYIAASLRHSRIRQWRVWALTILFATLSVGLWLKTGQLNELRDSERAEVRRAAMIAEADALIDRGDTALAKKVMLAGLARGAELPAPVRAGLQAAHLNEPRDTALTAPGAGVARGASISNDGTRLMSLWADGRARVWQRSKGQRDWLPDPLVLGVEGRSIDSIALAPDGDHAISTSTETNTDLKAKIVYVEFWSLNGRPSGSANGAPVRFNPIRKEWEAYRFPDHIKDQGFASVKYSPNGRYAVLADKGGAVALLDVTKPNAFLNIFGSSNSAITVAIFSPKGDKILTADAKGRVAIFDAAAPNRPLLDPIYVEDKGVTSVRFTDTGARFAVGTNKGPIFVYSSDGNLLISLPGHAKGVSSVAFSPDSTTIASGSPDGTVRLWEHGIASGRLLRTLTMAPPGAPPVPVNSVTFTPDGDTLVVATADGKVRLIDFNGEKLAADTRLVVGDRQTTTYWPGISRSRRVMLTLAKPAPSSKSAGAESEIVTAWDTRTRQRLMTVDAQGGLFDSILSPDGQRLAIFFTRRDDPYTLALDIYDVGKKPAIASVSLKREFPLASAMTADGKTLAMAMTSGDIMAWRGGKALAVMPGTANLLRPYQDGDPSVLLVSSPSGRDRFVLVGNDRRHATILDGVTDKPVTVSSDHDIETLRFSPDGSRLFIGTDVGTGTIYDTTSGKIVVPLKGRHDNAISFLAFNPDGTMVITASIDGTARLWDAKDGALRHILVSPYGANIAGFSSDGTRVVTGTTNRFATLWDVATGKKLSTLPGPLKSGQIIGWFAEDDRVVMTMSGDATLRRWCVATPPLSYDALVRDTAAARGGLPAGGATALKAASARSPCADGAQPVR